MVTMGVGPRQPESRSYIVFRCDISYTRITRPNMNYSWCVDFLPYVRYNYCHRHLTQPLKIFPLRDSTIDPQTASLLLQNSYLSNVKNHLIKASKLSTRSSYQKITFQRGRREKRTKINETRQIRFKNRCVNLGEMKFSCFLLVGKIKSFAIRAGGIMGFPS
jgi:hypothetical protein